MRPTGAGTFSRARVIGLIPHLWLKGADELLPLRGIARQHRSAKRYGPRAVVVNGMWYGLIAPVVCTVTVYWEAVSGVYLANMVHSSMGCLLHCGTYSYLLGEA